MAEDGVEFQGKTVEDAVVQAERHFDASRADLLIDVVTPGRSGVFGIGAEPARILARQRQQERQPVAAAVTEGETALGEPEAVFAPEPERSYEYERDYEEAEDETDDEAEAPSTPHAGAENVADEAADVLRTLLRTMGFDAEVSVRSREDPVMLVVTGQNLGVLIGRRGDNLSALQFMVNLILSKHRRHWPRVVIDVENYRARREESLRSLADRIAYRVRRSQRPFTLEAMPAGDRRIIHLSLRDATDVETYSIGEGVARRVVIAPKRDNQTAGAREYR